MARISGMVGAHHQEYRAHNDEWLTPRRILRYLGEFDLDPCAPIKRPWDTAKLHFTVKDNGLSQPWHGRVWLNPPYGNKIGVWMRRLSAHGNGIACVFARTETRWFFENVFRAPNCSGILFIQGRINFFNVDGSESKYNCGAPTCLISYDTEQIGMNRRTLQYQEFQIGGRFLAL